MNFCKERIKFSLVKKNRIRIQIVLLIWITFLQNYSLNYLLYQEDNEFVIKYQQLITSFYSYIGVDNYVD